MNQTWISAAGLGLEAIGLLAAAAAMRRSKPTYGGGYTESHWGWLGLGLAGVGLLVQLFDFIVRPLW